MACHTAKKWHIKIFYSFDRFFVLKILRKKITAARKMYDYFKRGQTSK